MNTLRGTELTVAEQKSVLSAFINRYTDEHTPDWVNRPGSVSPPVQFWNDADWLAHTWFAVNSDGSLARWSSHCESSPTWPRNPELREASKSAATAEKPAPEQGMFISQTLLDQLGNYFLATCVNGVWTFQSVAPSETREITAEDVEAGTLIPKSSLVQELFRYLNGLRITSDNIGEIRRECFVPWSSAFNDIVRDETAARENKEPRIPGGSH